MVLNKFNYINYFDLSSSDDFTLFGEIVGYCEYEPIFWLLVYEVGMYLEHS